MSLSVQRARVDQAERRMSAARAELARPAAALLERGRRRPLSCMGLAAGLGFVLGQFNLHPLRLPGLGALMGGGLVDLASRGLQMFTGAGRGD